MKKVGIVVLMAAALAMAGCNDDSDGGGVVIPSPIPEYVTCLPYSDNPRLRPIEVEPGRYDNPATICALRLCECDDQCFYGCPDELMTLECPNR